MRREGNVLAAKPNLCTCGWRWLPPTPPPPLTPPASFLTLRPLGCFQSPTCTAAHTLTHYPNQSNCKKQHFVPNVCFEAIGHISSQGPDMLKSLGGRQKKFYWNKKKRRNNRECWPASICSLNSSLFHCLFFSSNWNWLSYEMNIINAALSPPVAASDWAQHSPNYQRGTHQRWPAAASRRHLCSCACTCAHAPHERPLISDGRGRKKNEAEERTRTELANNMKMISAAHTRWRLGVACHNDSSTDAFLISRGATCPGF